MNAEVLLGGGGSFYAGIYRDHQAGYRGLCLMDHDAESEPTGLEVLPSMPGSIKTLGERRGVAKR